MAFRLTRMFRGFAFIFLGLALAVGALAVVIKFGLFSIIGLKSESNDSQVIQAIERTQEVSLLSLGIQGLTDERQCRTAFGKCVPGTTEKVFLQYNFDAKLGIDGAQVKVTKTAPNTFRISVPPFIFIGYDKPTFREATQQGGVLTWLTPDIDRAKMINKILDEDAQAKYLASNDDLLEGQTKVFYETLIHSIDGDAVTTFEFRSQAQTQSD